MRYSCDVDFEDDRVDRVYASAYKPTLKYILQIQREYRSILEAVAALEALGVAHPTGEWDVSELIDVIVAPAQTLADAAGDLAVERDDTQVDIRIEKSVVDVVRQLASMEDRQCKRPSGD